MKPVPDSSVVVHVTEGPIHWPVYWSAVWVGALASLASALVIGLIGAALGAHHFAPGDRIVRWSDVGAGAMIFTVLGAFFAAVIGGWTAGKIAGLRRADASALHGVIVWLLVIPMLIAFAALGAGHLFGGWYGGLAGTPGWVTPSTTAAIVDPNAAIAARNAALGTVTALLIGLIGSVLGGWMAAGEPMTLGYSRSLGHAHTMHEDVPMRRTA